MAKEPKKLDELFHDTLKDIYFAEKKILATLPKMAKAADSEELKAAFEKHHGETEGQIERLEQVFAAIDKKPQGKTCAAIPLSSTSCLQQSISQTSTRRTQGSKEVRRRFSSRYSSQRAFTWDCAEGYTGASVDGGLCDRSN
jgi:hypothetical protein